MRPYRLNKKKVSSRHQLNKKETTRINAVRLYLQVFFLSDITNSDGITINEAYLYPNKSTTRKSTLKWPTQQLPGEKAWKSWRAYIRANHSDFYFTLHSPLGRWIPTQQRTQHWNTVIDPTTNQVYSKVGRFWRQYSLQPNSQHKLQFMRLRLACVAVCPLAASS